MNQKIISVPQLITLFMINRLVISLTFGSSSINNHNIWDCVISSLLVFFITFILIIPMMMLFKNNKNSDNKNLDIVDINEQILGKFGKIISVIYAFYFLLSCTYTLSNFKIFIESVINPPISFLVLLTSIIIFACYSAAKGINAIARAGAIILFLTFFLLIMIYISLFKLIDFTNFRPFFYDGYSSLTEGAFFMLSRMSCIPAMGMLLPMCFGNIKKGVITWNFLVFFLMSSMIFLVTGVLGELSDVKLFPIYTATSAAKISKFENLDSLYLGLWTAGIFLKLSLFLNLSSECLRKSFGRHSNKIIIFLLGIILIITNMFTKISNIISGIFDTRFLFFMTIFTAFLVPLILLIIKKIFKFKQEPEI